MFDVLNAKTSRDAYKKAGADLVTFLIGACQGSLGKVEVETTHEQRKLSKKFFEALERGDESETSPLQNLLFSVFTQQLADQNIHVFPAYRFLVFYSFRSDGSIEPCNNITQIISKIVFFARGSIFMRVKSVMHAEHRGFYS